MATTHVSYNGKRLIPAPNISISRNYDRTGDTTKVGSTFSISVNGTIVAWKGSPKSDGTFWTLGDYPPDESIDADSRLAALIRKQEALRDLFSDDGLQFEVQSADGSQPLKCNPRIDSISFSEGLWFDRLEYSITLSTDVIYMNGQLLGEDSYNEFISTASESWSISADTQSELNGDPPTFNVTHTVSAQGKRFFDEAGALVKPAWQQAKDFVASRLGYDSNVVASGISNIPSYYVAGIQSRNEEINEFDGSYSVTETFILSSGLYREDYSLSITDSFSEGRRTISLNGTITGLETRDNDFNIVTNKYDNASNYWNAIKNNLDNRVRDYTSIHTNLVISNATVGLNPKQGTITYTYDYEDKPAPLITGSKSEVITINDSFGVQNVAQVSVLGRQAGPILQNISSKQACTRDLNIEVVFGADFVSTGNITQRMFGSHPRNKTPQSTEIDSIIDAANPVNAGTLNNIGNVATVAYITNQNESWDYINKRYSRQISFIYE